MYLVVQVNSVKVSMNATFFADDILLIYFPNIEILNKTDLIYLIGPIIGRNHTYVYSITKCPLLMCKEASITEIRGLQQNEYLNRRIDAERIMGLTIRSVQYSRTIRRNS